MCFKNGATGLEKTLVHPTRVDMIVFHAEPR